MPDKILEVLHWCSFGVMFGTMKVFFTDKPSLVNWVTTMAIVVPTSYITGVVMEENGFSGGEIAAGVSVFALVSPQILIGIVKLGHAFSDNPNSLFNKIYNIYMKGKSR